MKNGEQLVNQWVWKRGREMKKTNTQLRICRKKMKSGGNKEKIQYIQILDDKVK